MPRSNDVNYVFPADLAEKYTTNNIIQFDIYTYKGGGYNRLSPDKMDVSKKPQGELLKSIFLAIPSKTGLLQSSKWETTENVSGVEMGLIAGIKNRSWEDAKNGLNSEVLIHNIMTNLAKRVNDTPTVNTISAGTGITLTPYEENLFKGVAFRKFNFNFKFVPTSNDDIVQMELIIKYFRYASLPGLTGFTEKGGSGQSGDGNKLMTYPNIFQIKYKTAGNDSNGVSKLNNNNFLPQFKPAICDEVTVAYGGNQNYMSLTSDETTTNAAGIPIYCELGLKFTEIAYVTKEDVLKGY